jgi:hypothetical protein
MARWKDSGAVLQKINIATKRDGRRGQLKMA